MNKDTIDKYSQIAYAGHIESKKGGKTWEQLTEKEREHWRWAVHGMLIFLFDDLQSHVL